MEKTLIELIGEYRKEDNNKFLLITKKFEPVIFKYAKMLYKDEKEDTISELNLSLLEAIRKIEYYSNEGQCFTYLNGALKNRYLELYRRSKKKCDNELLFDNSYDYFYIFYEYDNAELRVDLERHLLHYNDKQRKILFSIFIEGKSSAKAASEYHVSRQYTTRIKNQLSEEIKNEYIA